MEENNKGMSFLVECEDCKQKFEISSKTSNVNHKRNFEINGKSIFLTYYDCPSCGRRHFVQIDDEVSLSKLREINIMFVKLYAAKKKGKENLQKQSAKFKKARQNLSDYRMKLMQEYTGKSVHDDETDSDFVLRFLI